MSRYVDYTDTVEYTNPTYRSEYTYPVEAEWSFGLGPQKGGPHNVSNPKRYDKRHAELIECTPDIWTQKFRDGATGEIRSETFTRWKHSSLEQSNYEPYGGFYDNIRNMAIDRCLANQRGDKRMEGGENIGQMKSTLNEIAALSSTVAKSYLALKHGRFGDIARYLGMRGRNAAHDRTLSDIWLSYQYGWKPLLSDIYTGARIVAEGFRHPDATFTKARGSAKDKHSRVYPYGDHELRWDVEAKAQCVTYYTVGSETLDGLDALGLINPLSIAWELMPYSFVADWFVPVGSFLSGLTASAGLNFTAGFVSRRIDVDFYYRRKLPDLSDGREWHQYGTWHSRTKSFAREVLQSFPYPRIYANPHPFSTMHIANAIALIRNMI